jgi:hypothetical protein
MHGAGSERVPNRSAHSDRNPRLCLGADRTLELDREALDAPEMGVEIAAALYRLFPKDFQLGDTLSLIGSRAVLDGIKRNEDPRRIAYQWEQDALSSFRRTRARYLLY